MTWLRTDDNDCDDPRVVAIIRTRTEHYAVLGMRQMLRSYAARHRTDGYLSGYVVRSILTKRWRLLFCAPPDGGTALLHHRPPVGEADVCECLKGRSWPPGTEYAVHGYLDTNPSAEETSVARAKAAELRDPELRDAVRRRDQDRCRYCAAPVRWFDHRSGRGGVLDHVDPAVADGQANLVVACRNCNSRKGNRTPAAAGMVLLDPPGTDPGSRGRSVPGVTTHVPRTGRDGTGRADGSATPGGPGRHDGPVGPPTTARTSDRPDPYRRRAITGPAPENHAGIGESDPDPDHPP